MTNVKPATDEQVADILGDLHQYHDYKMAECPFCAPIRARIDADREEIAANAHLIAEGIKVVNEQAAEIAALKADQSDWRKGVGFISAALGIDSLSCVDIAERGLEIRAERDALKAEVEGLTTLILDIADGQEDGIAEARAIRAGRRDERPRESGVEVEG